MPLMSTDQKDLKKDKLYRTILVQCSAYDVRCRVKKLFYATVHSVIHFGLLHAHSKKIQRQ
jgi:hypothetical protein